MTSEFGNVFTNLSSVLNEDYRGVNIAVYALATAGLAFSIHKIRPISKFSKATKIPDHFMKSHEPLHGVYAGVQHSPLRILVDHKAPIYLPLWHSSKPPLPVKIWGVDIVGGNAVSWLECVAKGQHVTLKPLARNKDDLVSVVILHLKKGKNTENINLSQKLVELGFAKASVPTKLEKNTLEFELAPVLLTAENRAKSVRRGIWSDRLPPPPFYVVYWRKGTQYAANLISAAALKILQIMNISLRNTLLGMKYLALRPFRSTNAKLQ